MAYSPNNPQDYHRLLADNTRLAAEVQALGAVVNNLSAKLAVHERAGRRKTESREATAAAGGDDPATGD